MTPYGKKLNKDQALQFFGGPRGSIGNNKDSPQKGTIVNEGEMTRKVRKQWEGKDLDFTEVKQLGQNANADVSQEYMLGGDFQKTGRQHEEP